MSPAVRLAGILPVSHAFNVPWKIDDPGRRTDLLHHQKRFRDISSASMAGSFFPVRNSIAAPPPVEICVNRSSIPSRSTAAPECLATNNRELHAGCSPQDLVSAEGERLLLK